ncbi:MAG: RNA polymerase sigma factor SigX [Chloroflexota bacterium]
MASVARGWVAMGRQGPANFEHLFVAEYPKVVAIAQHVLRDPHEAEDVAQDVFYSFYRQHPPDSSYARAWLHRAAAHAALNVVRGKRRRKQRESADAQSQERLQTTSQFALDPQHALEQAEQCRAVRRILSRLPDKRATVLALRYSGLSYAEVADALGVNVNQVGTLLRRAERAFVKEMEHETPQ